jgi:hypothetical protein
MKRAAHAIILCGGLAALSPFSAIAVSSVTLVWNPSPGTNIAGYKIYYGSASLAYTNSTDVGSVTNATVANLISNTTYFFAATAYDSAALESDYSTEVVYTNQAIVTITNVPPPPPSIALTSPVDGDSYAGPATINLAASVKANGHTITKVQFYNGSTLLAEETAAPYTFTWTNVSAGNYSLTAQAVYDSRSTVASAPATTVLVAAGRPISPPPTKVLSAQTLSITSPYAGQKWLGNAQFTVTGTVAVNAQVASVWYQVNSNGWQEAAGTTNWAAEVPLVPGGNTVQAYAVDASGNYSRTNSVSFTYVVTAPLVVNIGGNGKGMVSPNYNGQWLEIGANYALTASAGAGCAFANWTGSITTNAPTLQFTMASNLTFTANFIDVQAPTLLIASPSAGQRWLGGAQFTVKGAAADNIQVAQVWCQVNTNGWVLASGTTNWTAAVALTPGANTVRAYAEDASGHSSPTNSVSFTYMLSAPLVVNIGGSGKGTVSPSYNGQSLQIGANYALTAIAGPGCVFTNWTGSLTTNAATLHFTMASNLTFTANFIEVQPPKLLIASPSAGQQWLGGAQFAVKGTAADNVQVAQVWCQVNPNSQVPTNGWVLARGTTNWTAVAALTPGTNWVWAYAVGASGNCSQPTNSVSFTYVPSAPLQVQTAGRGTLSPNYSNAPLAIGLNYSMTATPRPGFGFANWTGGTGLSPGVLTNGRTVRFIMASNLTLQANFIDVQAPTLSIASPSAGQKWLGNAQFTVTGTAADNVQVASVWYQVNSNGWQEAAGTTNWAAAVPLVAGANTVRAYAVDSSGNYSRTNSVSFTYAVTAPLVVNLGGSGKGTVSPNYNGQWLQIGANYTLKASAGSGCVFTNWTGSLTTNAATFQFTMASNLTFTANFIDVQAPTPLITSPSAGQRWLGSAQFAVKGTAADNVQVAQVWCQVNTNGWVLASGTTNWTAVVALTPGANTVRAYAEDASGHSSRTNSASFTYVVSAPLVVNIGGSGKGTVLPNYNGQWLQIGANYTMTASASAGCVFTNWTGSLTTNAATLHFTMTSNLTFTANFVDVTRPTVTITSPLSGAQPTNGTLTASGTASDKVQVAGVYWNLNNSGWNLAATTNNWANWTAGMTLAPGPNTLAVYAVDGAGNRSLTDLVSFFCLENLLQTYWPMHDGDWKTFSGLITPVDMSFATNNQLNGSFVQRVILGEEGVTNFNHYQYGNTNTQVLLSEENAAGDDMLFSPFIAEQDQTQLLKGGTRQIATTLSLPDGQFPATAVITVSSIENPVTVPAGTFLHCKNVNSTIMVSVPGIGNIPLSQSAYVLAPGVGQIQISYYQASNSGFDLLGTDALTAGVINGVNVTNLTQAALAP